MMIIFNTWNAMIGVGTVTVPWAYQQSGIINGVIVTAVACILMFITNMVYLRTAGKDDNYSVTMQRYFPQYGWSISMLCFIVNFYVGIVLFFQVLSQSLYPIILFMLGESVKIDLATDWSKFSLAYTCLIVLGIVLIMTAPRDTMYIKKVNALGVVFVLLFLSFIFVTGVGSMKTTDYTYSKDDFADHKALQGEQEYQAYVPLFAKSVMPLMGIMGGGFYYHNMSLGKVHNYFLKK